MLMSQAGLESTKLTTRNHNSSTLKRLTTKEGCVAPNGLAKGRAAFWRVPANGSERLKRIVRPENFNKTHDCITHDGK